MNVVVPRQTKFTKVMVREIKAVATEVATGMAITPRSRYFLGFVKITNNRTIIILRRSGAYMSRIQAVGVEHACILYRNRMLG